MAVDRLSPENVHKAEVIGLWFISTSTDTKTCSDPSVMYLWETLGWNHGTVGIASDYQNSKDWPGYWETKDEALEVVRRYNEMHSVL